MTTGVAAAEWIKRIVDDERRRDAVRARETESAAQKAGLIRLNGRRLLDELYAAVSRDAEAFREEFPGDPARAIVVEPTDATGGFVVRKPASPEVTLTVTPRMEAAALTCHYRTATASGLPPREERGDLVFAGNGSEALQIRTNAGQVFAGADALSEYLLGPVFTGRPR